MKNIIYAVSILALVGCYSRDKVKIIQIPELYPSIDTNYCNYVSESGLPDDIIRIKMAYPCSFIDSHDYDTLGKLKRLYIKSSGSLTIGISLAIDEQEFYMTDANIDIMRSAKSLKQVPDTLEHFLYSDTLSINNVKAAYADLSSVKINDTYMRSEAFHLFCRHRVISIKYFVVGDSKSFAQEMFDRYEHYFKQMALRTEILN